MTPRVSVVLATYRRQDVLPRAVESVISQTMPDWELLVVDDEPSEETEQLVDGFGDPRIRYLRHERNRGLCAARNTGVRASDAEYVAFLDDDDVFFPDKLRRQVAALEAAPERTGVASCYEQIITSDGTSRLRAVQLEGDVHPRLLLDDLVRMQLLLVRRSCFDRVGMFDERLRAHDDFDMTLRLSRSFDFTTVPEALVGIIGTPGSMSTDVERRIEALETMMESHPELRENRRARARWTRRLARHHAELGREDDWRRLMRAAVVARPLDVGSWATLLAGVALGPTAHRRLGRLRGDVAGRLRRWRA